MIKPFQLRNVLTLAITLLACALILLVVVTVGAAGQRRVTDQVGNSMLLLADQMQDKLDRALYERVREVANTSELLERIAVSDPATGTRAWLDELQKGYPDYAWIAQADALGHVQTSTGSLLQGADVSQQPWFRDGLNGVTVGDVHEDAALSATLENSGPDPRRYVAISAPIRDAAGRTTGVLAALLDWSWIDDVRDSLFGTAPAGRTEQVFVLTKAGVVLLGPPSLTGRMLALRSVKAAVSGASQYAVERWPDGRDYVTGYARTDGYKNFAGLGWIVLVRQDADLAMAPVRRLQQQTVAWSIALAALGALVAWLLSRRISSPLLRLANSADAIRTGVEVRIPKLSDYAEVATLSRSLETLVSELKQRQEALSRLNVSLEGQVAERTSELLVRNTALTLAREDAEAATAAKSRFLAAASHDLRQPLHAMTLFARALSRRVSGNEAPRLVEQLELSLVSLKEMFDALLNVSRLDAGLIQPQLSSVSVSDVLERISEAFRAEAEARGLEFKCRAMNATITTDAALFETILRNLVANALKFTQSGGVLLAAHRREGRVAFEVWDTGAGIPAANQERIFGEFERAGEDAAGPNEGLGLGLSIVKRYASLLDVDVRLASRVGRGTAVTLLLPDAGVDFAPRAVQRADAGRETTLRPGLGVLLIDDDQQILAAMERELIDRGCRPQSFASGAEAEAAVTAGWRPDVAIVDFNLGDTTGIEVLDRLERLIGPMPSLILTGGTDAETLSAVVATGRPWLIKPADPEAVARHLKELAGGTSQ